MWHLHDKPSLRLVARAEVLVTIEELLDHGLPKVYTPEQFEQKTMAVFQHAYDAYYGAGRSVHAVATSSSRTDRKRR